MRIPDTLYKNSINDSAEKDAPYHISIKFSTSLKIPHLVSSEVICPDYNLVKKNEILVQPHYRRPYYR
jgi:hypothetical protein